jgi:ribonuclease HII
MKHVSASQIAQKVAAADAEELAILEQALASDPRKSVQSALAKARRRLEALQAEAARLAELYDFEMCLAASFVNEASNVCNSDDALDVTGDTFTILGLDEVGRGPVAGPVAVGAVVLNHAADARIARLNDSKQIKPAIREEIAAEISKRADFACVQYVDVAYIDAHGIAVALRLAFSRAIEQADAAMAKIGRHVDVVLLDGVALHLDSREVNVIKGDSKCASIAAASILAKVDRDAFMARADADYPGYDFAQNAGYGTKAHGEAIRRLGLSPLHRKTFCATFTQNTLF